MTATLAPTRRLAARRELDPRTEQGRAQQYELAQAAVAGDERAAEQLVASYTPLIRSLAHRAGVIPGVVDLDDLVAVGQAAAYSALARLDLEQCESPLGFLLPRIRGAMVDHLRTMDTRPRSVLGQRRRLARQQDAMSQRLGREVGPAEAARQLGMSREDTEYLSRSIGEVSCESIGTAGDYVAELADPTASDFVDAVGLRDELATALARLPERHRYVLLATVVEQRPAVEVARELGVAGSRISQIKARALEQLRVALPVAA